MDFWGEKKITTSITTQTLTNITHGGVLEERDIEPWFSIATEIQIGVRVHVCMCSVRG